MNADLWMGIAIGGITVLVILILAITLANRGISKRGNENQRRDSDLLERRNWIGERQLNALETICVHIGQSSTWHAHEFSQRKKVAAKERRERIATACFPAIMRIISETSPEPIDTDMLKALCARGAVSMTDALIAELDRKEERHG